MALLFSAHGIATPPLLPARLAVDFAGAFGTRWGDLVPSGAHGAAGQGAGVRRFLQSGP
jgi:hypothetical protein